MERTKQPQNQKRRRQWVGRIARTVDKKKGGVRQTKQDTFRFAKNNGQAKYLDTNHGKRLKKLHAKRRAAAKRAKASRKRNR